MEKFVLEICVDSVESALAAQAGGGNRLELCQNLVIGGTTPSVQLFRSIHEKVDIPINVLIRPRFGDFCYTDHEFSIIIEEIKMFEAEGANGVVIGCLTPEGHLDEKRLELMKKAAGHMEITIHRCFDMCVDPYEALAVARAYEVNTILTSGQKNSALDGMMLLKDLAQQAGKVDIMAGSGINAEVIKEFIDNTAITSFHMSGKANIDSAMTYRKEEVSMGLKEISEYTIWRTDEAEVRKARTIIEENLG